MQIEAQKSQKTGLWKRIRTTYPQAKRAIAPGPRAWRGAALGALAALAVILLAAAFGMFGKAPLGRFLVGVVFFFASFALIGSLITLVWRLLRSIPLFYAWVLGCAVPALALMALTTISVSIGFVLTGMAVLMIASLLGASLSGLAGSGWQAASRLRRFITLAGLFSGIVAGLAGGVWLLGDGSPSMAPPNAAALSGARVEKLALPDPSLPGSFAVRTLFYGSGSDRHRPEYGADVDLITRPVDGSSLVDGWSDLRTAYWGFGPKELPLNGRVWYPEGDGPFPLVLVVHGQHPMEDYSDGGYAYLGALLASRGFIVSSVDENFLNLSPLVDLLILQSLKGENDLRGWLLLEHLRVWQEWNDRAESPFYQKADMDRIALIGHSRGGEAVAAAAAFNRLPYAPDDAGLRLDYNFNIRSLVGIAPVDGTTLLAGQEIVLENVNYLLLHGAHDMDVFTFQGSRQYQRVVWTEAGDWIKAAVYIYGANHGQFNTRWGRKDLFEPAMRVFNLEQLMPMEEQQQAAAVTISAFLETTLHGETSYRAFFQDLRRGKDWLPDTIYLHRFQDAQTERISTFEEDINLTTTSLSGGRLSGENFNLWREQPAQAKWGNLGNQVVYLGWDGQVNLAAYTMQIPANGLSIGADSVLVFSMADASENPAFGMDWVETPDRSQPIDLTVEVVDRAGEVARLPLSDFALLQPQIEGLIGKARFMSPFPASEVVLQHFEFPLQDFVAVNPALQPADLTAVRFLFDRTPSGVIALDDIGFRKGN